MVLAATGSGKTALAEQLAASGVRPGGVIVGKSGTDNDAFVCGPPRRAVQIRTG